ncbi:MAG: sig56 [Frankiales bacterium]|nr:sig56 [Frankiales bacterium]
MTATTAVNPLTLDDYRAEPILRPTAIRVDVTSAEGFIVDVVHEHGAAMLAYATRLTGDHYAAEDVVQEALLRSWRHPDVFSNGRGSIRGWLLTVIRHIVIDQVRARSARPTEVADTGAPDCTVDDHADSVIDGATVDAMLQVLSADQRRVIEQLYFSGHTVNEAAAELAIPPGTVKSRTHYALRALRNSPHTSCFRAATAS